jgi:DNA-binding SARP family transcriptional activator
VNCQKWFCGRGPFSIILLLFFTLIYTGATNAQSYGLGFHSHDVVQDKRTSLDLFPGKPYCPRGDFELSFELSFLPGYTAYFGYIFRLIKDDKENIDFIYDERSSMHKRFKMVLGEGLTRIAFDLDSNRMFKVWNKFRLRFDFKNDKLFFYTDSAVYIQEKAGLTGGSCFKLYFGTNLYKQFKVTDVPPMKIRNIRLSDKGSVRFEWPLDERDSLVANEVLNNADGAVINPIWIRNEHYAWKEERALSVKGCASVAFNAEKGLLYIAGGDSMLTYSAATGKLSGLPYSRGPQFLLKGNQSLYSPFTGDLYNLYIDQQLVSTFDFKNGTWGKDHLPGPVTDYWHFSKFFSEEDTSLYLLGGYGHFQYRNSLFRYHIPSGTWQKIDYSGDHVVPRYLCALAATPHTDSVYILGGYGSQTGQQILNPQSIYDMMLFDVRRRTFKKLYEIKPGKEDFVFANSLVLNERKNIYYGLIFPNYRYHSKLQLIRGSLSAPGYTLVGDTIPYFFHDITSYADLFFAPKSDKFLAVTLLTDSLDHNQTKVMIYSLVGPPVTGDEGYPAVAGKKTGLSFWLYSMGVLVILGAGAVFAYRRFGRVRSQSPVAGRGVGEVPVGEPRQVREEPFREGPGPGGDRPLPAGSALFLFGEMQIFDQDGIDITRQFTPLIRELFLLILLYSVRKGTGVSSEKLTEILWSDKPTNSARNNRSVNIAKLKALVDKLGYAQLSKDTGYWKIELDPGRIRLDYQEYLSIVKDKKKLNKERINELANITQRGGFLSNIEYEWLDDFKSEVSNDIIDTYSHFAHSMSIGEDPDFLLKLVNYIFYFDPANEDAIKLKCKTLAHVGKHSLAKAAFDSFIQKYKLIYGEEYGKNFQEVLES